MTRDRAGFTLVELLVALVVTGLVVAAAQAALAVAVDTSERTRAERSATLSGATARSALEHWLRAAAIGEGMTAFVGARVPGEPPQDRLSFSVSDGGALHPGPHHLELWVDADPGTARAGLVASLTPTQASTATRADTLVLAPAALGLSVRYQVLVGGQIRWQTSWDSDRLLPRGVRLELFAPPVEPRYGGLPPLWRAPITVGLSGATR